MRKVRPGTITYIVTHSIKNDRSSSLQQLQMANKKLERELGEIKVLIERGGSSSSIDPPLVSGVTGGLRDMSLLSAELMKQAEQGGRKWSAIGVDDWIEAGKWWLMKVG